MVWSLGDAEVVPDGFALENGNFVIAWKNEVLELTRQNKVKFRYSLGNGNREIGSVAPLPTVTFNLRVRVQNLACWRLGATVKFLFSFLQTGDRQCPHANSYGP